MKTKTEAYIEADKINKQIELVCSPIVDQSTRRNLTPLELSVYAVYLRTIKSNITIIELMISEANKNYNENKL